MSELDPPWRTAVRAVSEPERDAIENHVRAAIDAGALPAHADELVLAWRVARGDRDAVARFEREIADEIAMAVRKVDSARTFVDEIGQTVRVRLLVGEDGKPPRIATYGGKGPLRAWVAIAALRMALNAKRAVEPVGDDVLADVVDREPDPELRHLRVLYRAELRQSLTDALGALSDRDRALLRMRFVASLGLAQIGKLYAVSEATASRWLAAIVRGVQVDTRKRLVARLSVSAATADSVARMVASQLDLSIARLLQ